ncbi:MAG: glycogen debranching protein, partial [Lentisphaerae bacterium]|nr:glycogen debranching protein [Lentisphaerota bacterium]
MMLEQTPKPGSRILLTTGTLLQVTLQTDPEQSGRAVLRTNIGRAAIRRHEIIAATEADTPPLARDWHDLTMTNAANGLYTIDLPLDEVGWFGAKACFIPEGSEIPQWPAGDNLAIKVSPATTACANTIYTAFVRQFGSALHHAPHTPRNAELAGPLLAQGYSVIPPSGTFRNLVQKLDTIMGHMRFNIIQLLPIHPTPTTFARMGLYGSPFAARDLLDVDPALAEFDTRATPLDQFRELVDAVHARQGRLFLDIPANHTGWASTLQIHHPEWFKQNPDGSFKSPGAWGVIWEDLVELDYSNRDLRAFMAEVFIFWCRQGVDGFRCDAGYMIPAETWTYIVARVRDAFPETTFMLEGLGGKIEVTDTLLANSNLDWAYAESFQHYDRDAFEKFLPAATALSETNGPLVHFAETHDNDRLASRGENWARMRTPLAALLSQQGSYGITAGVEWFAADKIAVHGAPSLNWDSPANQVDALARLNAIVASHPAFSAAATLSMIQGGPGNVLALLREPPPGEEGKILGLVNLDPNGPQTVFWPAGRFLNPTRSTAWDLLTGEQMELRTSPDGTRAVDLEPGRVRCLCADPTFITKLNKLLATPPATPPTVARLRRNALAIRVIRWLAPQTLWQQK